MLSYWNQPAGEDMERQHREKLMDSLLLSAALRLKVFTVDLKLTFHVIWRICNCAGLFYSSLPQDGDSSHIIPKKQSCVIYAFQILIYLLYQQDSDHLKSSATAIHRAECETMHTRQCLLQ